MTCYSCQHYYQDDCCEPVDFCPSESSSHCLPPIVVPCVPTPEPTPEPCVYDCSPPLWATWPNVVIQNCISPCGVAPTPDCPCSTPSLKRCNGGCL
jgi:hypothetical protein